MGIDSLKFSILTIPWPRYSLVEPTLLLQQDGYGDCQSSNDSVSMSRARSKTFESRKYSRSPIHSLETQIVGVFQASRLHYHGSMAWAGMSREVERTECCRCLRHSTRAMPSSRLPRLSRSCQSIQRLGLGGSISHLTRPCGKMDFYSRR